MPRKIGDATKHTIYQRIRADIITGQKKPGERLSIDILKNEFGTSVTPVRDALQMLSQEDLVTIKPENHIKTAKSMAFASAEQPDRRETCGLFNEKSIVLTLTMAHRLLIVQECAT